MKISKEALKSLAMEAVMMPQEEMLEIGNKRKNLYIGIPRETSFQETASTNPRASNWRGIDKADHS